MSRAKVTGETPKHAAGKCNWTEGGKLACLRPAVAHFLIGQPPTDWCTWACAEHVDQARELPEVFDEHPADYTCLAAAGLRGQWIYSTPDRVGWCEPDNAEENHLLTRELVHSGAPATPGENRKEQNR